MKSTRLVAASFTYTRPTATVWLGTTMGCAECHSHKYDPFTQREFYSLFAFFNNANEKAIPAPNADEQAACGQANKAQDADNAKLKAALDSYPKNELPPKLDAWLKTATLDLYGAGRKSRENPGGRGGGPETYSTFARNCVLARRMVERGVRFVTLLHASWDHHSNINQELPFCAGMADQPIAALVRDLKQRGMLDDTMVIWASEFGRTPLGENRGGSANVTGRDHHPFAFSMWLAGGGIKGGQVIGETDEIGWGVVKDPVAVPDLHATILKQFGFDHERLTYRSQGLDFKLTGFEGAKVVGKMLA